MKKLSEITKIGEEVVVEGLGKIRLLDTNYNGSGKKIWQFTDIVKNDVYLGYPNDENTKGYPSAKGVLKVLNDIYDKLPKWLKEQILIAKIPCYIPETKRNRLFSCKLFLLSCTELCQNGYERPFEGRPLEYYINHCPTWKDWQWLRSPNRSYSSSAWNLNGTGTVGSYSAAYSSNAVVPAFVTD